MTGIYASHRCDLHPDWSLFSYLLKPEEVTEEIAATERWGSSEKYCWAGNFGSEK